jgi:hypothetical protein
MECTGGDKRAAARRADDDTERQRKARNARAYRQRGGDPIIGVRVRPSVSLALIEQSLDAGLTEKKAEAESRNREKVAIQLEAVTVQWAHHYLEKRKRFR